MKKTVLFMLALVTSLVAFAQTNLTSGKTVVPLGGLKSYNNGTTDYTISNDDLQKITVDGNTDNVYLFPEAGGNWSTDANKAIGIQGFYIDLGATKSIGALKSTWEGADCGANIYVTDTEPAADGSLTGETLIATFDNAQASAKDAAIAVENSGRYIVFVPTEATNWGWGVKIRTFAAFEKEASVLTTLLVTPTVVKVGEPTEMTFTPQDQVGLTLTGVTYSATNATLEGNILTATAAGDVVITATLNEVSVQKTIQAITVSAPTTNPTEPTDLAANVIAVYSAKYNKGINDSNPGWGIGGGAPNPLYTKVEEVEIAEGHKVVHVNGAGFNSRTAGGVGPTNAYTSIHVAVYPFTATECKIFGDNAYDKAITKTGLVPGEWNYVEVANDANFPNYVLIELVDETEFYLDHFYFAKPALDDNEAPVMEAPIVKSSNAASVTLTLKATDNKSQQVTFVVTDKATNKTYTTKAASGTAIDFAVAPLASNTEFTFSIVAKDDNENTSAPQEVSASTSALTAAPVPTQDAADVLSIYSDAYTPATTYNYGAWGQSTAVEEQSIGDDKVLSLTNFNYLGFEFNTQLDLSAMENIHIDVFPLETMELGITPIMTGGVTEKPTKVGTLVPGQWNSFDLKLSDFGFDLENYKAFQLKIDQGKGNALFVDNIYFWKGESGDDPIIDNPTSGEGSYTIPSGLNAGKDLKYTWAYTQNGMDVTVTYACTNKDEIVGIVDGYIHDKSNGFAEFAGLTYTWTNCTEGQVLTSAHKWMFAEGDFVTPDFTYTVKAGTTPVQTITAITVTAEKTSIEEGKTTQLTVKDQDDQPVAANKLTFSSNNEAAATVSAEGVVTAVAVGTATITATLKDNTEIKNTIEITVTEVATSGEETYTIPSGLNEGKELKYTWEFTQNAMDVTVTFACTNKDDIIGIVDGYVFADGIEIHGEDTPDFTLSYTWKNCTEGQVLTSAHKWMFAEGDFLTPDFTYTVKAAVIPIPTEPTADEANVLAVYSAKYGKEEITTSSPAWGGYKDATGEDLYTSYDYKELKGEGDATHKVVHVVGTGINSRTKDDTPATGYNKFHAAIYPTTATSGIIFKDNGYNSRITIEGLVPGQWNYVEKSVEFDNAYITIALDGETEFYVDHIYYEKVADTQAPVISEASAEAGYAVAVIKATATDDNEGTISYTFTLGETVKEATAASGEAAEVTFDELTMNTEYSVSIVAKDAAGNESEAKTVTFTTMGLPAIPAAPAPTADAKHVQGIYTDAYNTPAGVQFMNWHGVDVIAEEVTASDNDEDKLYRIYTNKGFNYYGMQLDKVYDLAAFKTIHVDIWSSAAATIGFSPINQATEPHTAKKELTLAEGWNQFDIDVTDYNGMDVTIVDQLEFFDAPADIVVAIDNIYFVSDNVLTGITSVEKSDANNSQNIYTLDGRKVKNPRKGVYIVDGKKVMIK